MFDRLESISRHYEEIQRFMTEPDIVNDTEKYLRLMRESSELEPLYTTYKRYLEAVAGEKEALEMLASEKDPEMIELAKAELAEAKENQPTLIKELQILLLPKDENDDKNIIMEIRGGAGGDEAALFAAELYRMYINYAERRGYKTELMSVNETGIGGMKEVVFVVTGKGAYSRLKYEAGVHRVQRVPVTESGGRIHTSTATVAVMPEAEDVDVEINPADVKMEVFRSSGAGGQHINKTSSAVRLIHIPTGMVAECQEERSQLQNREKAMRLLRARLYEIEYNKKHDEAAEAKRSQVGTGDRSEKIRTYNFPQGRVTDHRIGLTLYSIDKVLNGDLDPLLDPIIAADQAAKLAELNQEVI
ncbi:peptide chain release factor 1 [Oribacterium sp. P9]|uniref:peptide chain release factor 1 n=1 Tax=unclassified Oribacterium TaxID=2629782 RepID=UPI002A77B675|nr:peptide chain release factor 1 [Oribacterium sp.]MDD6519762.1 peptide chain release factor 1 [Oribacterium sp.]MDY2854294.1 peptide chain release factor 1 [Oliverpabstia sp.]